MSTDSILFPNLGITLAHVGAGIQVGPIWIAFYGICIAAAMLAGIYLAMFLAGKTGQDPDMYFNFAIVAVILSVLGARLYYVAFSWDYYGAHPAQILDLRGGGLAILGGVITGVLCAVVFCRWKKKNLWLFLDTALPAVLLGQVIGRWGNFFNREVFGGYTNNLLAMALPQQILPEDQVTEAMILHAFTRDKITFVQVHPTFLYESLWNLALLLLMLWIILGKHGADSDKGDTSSSLQKKRTSKKETIREPAGKDKDSKTGLAEDDTVLPGKALLVGRKRFHGQIACLYLLGYGLGRFWIEAIRTDRLLIPGTTLAVSQVLAGVMVLAGTVLLIIGLLRSRKMEQGDGSFVPEKTKRETRPN